MFAHPTTFILSTLLLFIGVFSYFTNKDIKERQRKRKERTLYLKKIKKEIEKDTVPTNESKLKDYKEFIKEFGLFNEIALRAQWLISYYYRNLIKKDLKYAEEAIKEYFKIVESLDKRQKSLNMILFLDDYLFADESLFQIANIYFYELLDMQKSCEIYKQLLDKYPKSKRCENAKYKVYLIENNADFDSATLKQYAIALKYEEEDKHEEAIKILHKTAENYPNCKLEDDILLKIGYIYQFEKNDYKKALLAYQRLISKYRESDLLEKCYDYQGKCYLSLNKWEEAENCYRIIMAMTKNLQTKAYCLYQISICYENLGQLEESLNVCKDLKRTYPSSVWAKTSKLQEEKLLRKISERDVKWVDVKSQH